MKTFSKKAFAAVITLAVMLSSVVFDVPGKMTVKGASVVGGCDGVHSAGTAWNGDEPLENDGRYYLENSLKLSEEIEIEGNVTLCLNGQTITAASGSCIFKVKKDGSLTICDCKEDGIITGGDNSYGGAVYVEKDGTFTLSGGTISGNSAKQGGGVYNAGIFNMNGGIISENSSDEGGGVYVSSEGAEFEMTGGTILENTAGHEGGGVYVGGSSGKSGVFTMSGGAISGNTVKYKADASDNGGGGVYTAGTFTMSGSGTISGNTAGTVETGNYCMGGGVCVSGTNAEFIMNSGTLSGNKAIYGGGVYVSTHGTFKMTGGTIGDANYAVNGGGGVGMGGGEFLMSGGIISENTTERRGGGVYLNNTGKFTMSSGTISDNASRDGGGVHLANGEFTMNGGAVSNNTASRYGGGVCLDNGEFTMNDGAISDNTSSEGGGVYLRGGEFTMSDGAISNNAAEKVDSCVYVGNENGGGTITLNGEVEISSQKESNVYLKSGKTITIGEFFSTDREIGIHPENVPNCKVFVPATTFDTNVTAVDISAKFKADLVGQSVLYNDKLGRVELKGEHNYDNTKWENNPDDHWHECTVCGDKKDTAKHNWDGGKVTSAPNCTEEGEKTYTCKDCNRTKTEPIPAEHKYDDTKWENDPDDHWHECTVCHDKKDTEKHNWDGGKVTKAPTCIEEGEKTYTCKDCNRTKMETILPDGHKYDDTKWENDPDDHWHECTVCCDKKDTAKHNWDDGKVTRAPTCTEAGEKTYTCEDCKRTKTEPIPAEHKYDDTKWENDPEDHWHECTVCGDKKDIEKHNWNSGTVTKKPTYTESGEIKYICIDCMWKKTEKIPPKDPEDFKYPGDFKVPENSKAPENSMDTEKSEDTENSKEPENSKDLEYSKDSEDSKNPEDSKDPEDTKVPDVSDAPNYPDDSSVTDDSNSSTEISTRPYNNGGHENVIPNNPPTGIAISLVPPASAIIALIITLMRKKK